MVSKPSREPCIRAVTLRLPKAMRGPIDRAAKAHGKSRSAFMIDAIVKEAERTLFDRTMTRLDPASDRHTLTVLAAPRVKARTPCA